MYHEYTLKLIQFLTIFVFIIIFTNIIYINYVAIDDMNYVTDKLYYNLSVFTLILWCLYDIILISMFVILLMYLCIKQIRSNNQQDNHYIVYP